MDNAMAIRAGVVDDGPRRNGHWSEEACVAFYQEHAPRLFRLAYWALLGDREAAAAVVSGVFARCLETAAGEPSDRLGRKLEGMGVRALREALREPEAGPEAAGIGMLRPEQRLAFLLHDSVGYPLARCAELLELEPPVCRQLLFAARLRLCQSGGVWRRAPAA